MFCKNDTFMEIRRESDKVMIQGVQNWVPDRNENVYSSCKLIISCMLFLLQDQLTQALKTTANLIFQEGGIIRKLNNMGLQPTPYRMASHGQKIKQAK